MRPAVIMICLSILAAGGCRRRAAYFPPVAPSKPPPAIVPSASLLPGILRVSPSELLQGDVKRLEPHLGFSHGAVRLEYEGPRTLLRYGWEFWRDGKKLPDSSTSGIAMSLPYEAEITFSLHEETSAQGEPAIKTVMAEQEGTRRSSTVSRWPAPGFIHTGWKDLDSTLEIPDGESAPVWSIFKSRTGLSYSSADTFDDLARRSDWAMVLRIWTEEKE